MTSINEDPAAYAARLADLGYENITIYRYWTALDNRLGSAHVLASGHAVRYTSSTRIDEETTPRGGKPGKFHDRSITLYMPREYPEAARVFYRKLTREHGRIVADIPGEEPAAYWTAAYSPGQGDWDVLMKRFTARPAGRRGREGMGPGPMFHLIMEEEN